MLIGPTVHYNAGHNYIYIHYSARADEFAAWNLVFSLGVNPFSSDVISNEVRP